jgi:hypothetical protein
MSTDMVKVDQGSTDMVKVDQGSTEAIVRVHGRSYTGSEFELEQRICKLEAAASILPEPFRGSVSNIWIARRMAENIGTDEDTIMNNLNYIHGRRCWSAQFLIGMVNTCGRFSPIRYKDTGEIGKLSRGCVAYATELSSGEVLLGDEVTLDMARAEGWSTKQGSKWATMPGQMLRYRAAAFWIRTYAPELSLGMHTTEEVQDIGPQQGPQPEAGLLARLRASPTKVDGPSGVPTLSHIGSVTANRMTLGAPFDEDVPTPQHAGPPCREPGEEG